MKILVGYKGTNVGKDLLDIAIKHARAFDGVAKQFIHGSFA